MRALCLLIFLASCTQPRGLGDLDSNYVPELDDDDSADDDDATDPADDDDATDPADDDDATDLADDDDATDAPDDDDATDAPDDDDAVDDGPTGWIGSPCEDDNDCSFADGVCFTDADGFPRGTCTAGCDLFCSDEPGHPVTFCAADGDLPASAPSLDDGACLSRCDFSWFPLTGCRPDYGCVIAERANEAWTEQYVCMPGAVTDLSSCHLDLAARGVSFEPTIRQVDHPSGEPSLDCLIEDPVWILSPLLGVELRNTSGAETERVLAGCPMAHALADTVEDVEPFGVNAVRHIGTYNCRVISNTTTLSQHAFANAIDLYGFDFDDGSLWTLEDHWEHETSSPGTTAGAWLYDTAYRWNAQQIWNIILTPNYNEAHDNHFHVDLTPGSDFIGLPGNDWTGWGFIGPAPYSD